jgi:hypothetical protein
MEHHTSRAKALLLANLWVMVAACDTATEADAAASVQAQGAANVVVEHQAVLEAEAKAVGPVEVGAELAIESASFDLEAVAGVVQEGEVDSAAALEVVVNDEARGYNRIDIDADGKIDHIQVVEVKGPSIQIEAEAEAEVEADLAADAVLELRAVPSSSGSVDAAVTFATVSFARHPVDSAVEIRAGYTAVVRQPKVKVYARVVPVEIDAGALVGGSLFLRWVYTVERPVYVGTYEVDARGHWIPPGHVKHGHWKATGDASGRGHVQANGRAGDKGGKNAFASSDGRVAVDVRGSAKGSGKVVLGGSGKGGSKPQASGSAGGSAKVKSGSGGTGKSGTGKSGTGKGGAGK